MTTNRPVSARLRTRILGLVALIAVIVGFTAHAQYSAIPFAETFDYTDGSSLDGQNGWEIYVGGVSGGTLPDEYHGWFGEVGGTATAQNGMGELNGVSLENWFGDYTGNPGTDGSYDKETAVSTLLEYVPPGTVPDAPEPTIWSKDGNMFNVDGRWNYENRGTYYKMMPTVRWFVKRDGLVSAYDGHLIKHLSHTPLTKRTWVRVDCDYINQVWSLTLGDEKVVDSFALYKPDDASTMLHDGWYKDYDGLKRIRLVGTENTNDTAATVDNVRVLQTADVPPLMSFAVPSDVDVEGTYTVTGMVTLSEAPIATTTADLIIAGGTATDGVDYTFTPVTLTFDPGETNQTFTFGILDDFIDEGDETILFNLTNVSANVILGTYVDYTFTIDDTEDLAPTVTFSPAAASFPENASNATATVVLSHVYSGTVTVEHLFASASSTATQGSDFTSYTSGFLAFNPGETNKTFSFEVIDDPEEETDETIVFKLGDITNGIEGASSNFTYTIEWDLFDVPPTVEFSPSADSGPESATNVSATVVLSHAYVGTVTVEHLLAASPGSATAGEDYSYSQDTLIFASGETNKSFSFIVIDDDVNEIDENVVFKFGTISNGVAGSADELVYTIEDDSADWYTLPFLEPFEDRATGDLNGQHGWDTVDAQVQTTEVYTGVKAGEITANNGYMRHAFGGASTGVWTDVRTKVVYTAGTPTPPLADSTIALFVSTNGQVVVYDGTTAVPTGRTLPEGQWARFTTYADYTSGTWDLFINLQPGGQYSFYSAAVPALDGFMLKGGSSYTDDIALTTERPAELVGLSAVLPKASFLISAAGARESAHSVTGTVVLSEMPAAETTVDVTLVGGTATDGSDFTYLPTNLTFAAGETSKTFTFDIIDDSEDEGDETIIFDLTNPSSNCVLGATQRFTYTIQPDLSDTPPTVSFAPSVASGPESAGSVTGTVVLSHNEYGLSVSVEHLLATPGGTATAGDDYVYSSDTLVFAPGEISKYFTFTIVDDSLEEPDETIVFALGAITNGKRGTASNFTYTIAADLFDIPPTVIFSPDTASGPEDAGSVTGTVVLSHAYVGTVTVGPQLASPGGTATEGDDFTFVEIPMVFTSGETNKTFEVTVIDDTDEEPDETVVIELGTVTGGVPGIASNFTYTILADASDVPPTVTFSPATASFGESAATGTATLVLSHAYSGVLTVEHQLVPTGTTATAGSDFAYSAGQVTFNAGETSKDVTFEVIDDTEEENDETIMFVVDVVSNAVVGAASNFTYTIEADSSDVPPTVSFALAASSAPESTTPGAVAVVLSHAYSGTLTVNHDLASPSGTAESGTDYTYTPDTLTFGPGVTSQEISFTVVDDGLQEADETIIFALSGVANGVLGANTNHTYTIEADAGDWSLPFEEPFEARTLGALDGQYGWVADGAHVQDSLTFGGSSKAGTITNDYGFMSHPFTDGRTKVWADMRLRVVYSQAAPEPPASAAMAFYVAPGGQVMAYDGTTPVATGRTALEGEWVRFTACIDYGTTTWTLYVNGVPGGEHAFFNPAADSFRKYTVYGKSTCVDNVLLSDEPPALLAPSTLIIVR